MTKPTMELIEDYAAEHALLQTARMCKMPDAAEDHADMKLRHFAEIRQRLEAMEQREAELESDLAEAAKCAFQYAAKVGELERDAARFVAFFSAFAGDNKRFLTAVMDALPEDGESLDYIRAAIDAAMAEGD